MKILFVTPFPPARDGIGTYSQMMVTELRSSGHEALVVLPRAQHDLSGDVIGALTSRRSDLAALCSKVAAWSPDVIHVQFAVPAFGIHTYALLIWLRLIRATTKVPVLITMHEVTRDTAALRSPGRALYRALARSCDHLIVHTRSAMSALTGSMAVPTAKVSVIAHPVPRPPSALATPAELRTRFGLDDTQVLLAFGFIHVDKGLPDCVRALDILREPGRTAIPDVRLVVAGAVRPRQGVFRLFELRDRVHLARVMRAARASGVISKMVLTGYVPEGDIAAWFDVASAVVLPYRRAEQSGVAALADSFGVPVIASTAGGLSEIYARSEWSFPPRDPVSLAKVLSRFLLTPPGDRTTAGNSRPRAGLSTVIDTTLALYRAVVG